MSHSKYIGKSWAIYQSGINQDRKWEIPRRLQELTPLRPLKRVRLELEDRALEPVLCAVAADDDEGGLGLQLDDGAPHKVGRK